MNEAVNNRVCSLSKLALTETTTAIGLHPFAFCANVLLFDFGWSLFSYSQDRGKSPESILKVPHHRLHATRLMLDVQEVRSSGIRQEVENTKHASRNVRSPAHEDNIGPRRQLNDECN